MRIERGVLDGKLLEIMNGQDTYVCFSSMQKVVSYLPIEAIKGSHWRDGE